MNLSARHLQPRSAAADRAELERRRLVRDAETKQRRAERRHVMGGGGGGDGLGNDDGVDDIDAGAVDGLDGRLGASGHKLAYTRSSIERLAEGGMDGENGFGLGGAGDLGDETLSAAREGNGASRLGASRVSNAAVEV